MFAYIGITETPVTQTANYYSSVTFTCRGTGDILNWTVDTLPVDETTKGITINDTSDGHDLSSNLTIEVPPTNDDSIIIGCVIVTISPYDIRGPTAKLIIRGTIITLASCKLLFNYRSVISRECQLES